MLRTSPGKIPHYTTCHTTDTCHTHVIKHGNISQQISPYIDVRHFCFQPPDKTRKVGKTWSKVIPIANRSDAVGQVEVSFMAECDPRKIEYLNSRFPGVKLFDDAAKLSHKFSCMANGFRADILEARRLAAIDMILNEIQTTSQAAVLEPTKNKRLTSQEH